MARLSFASLVSLTALLLTMSVEQAVGALQLATTASLPFEWTYPRQCTPINVTFTPQSDGYPYSIYILGIGSNVQSWVINKDYQPDADKITFQYFVPEPSPYFNSFMIAIADSKGNGNSSSVLPVNADADAPKNCGVYAQTSAFVYASDSTVGQPGDRPVCTALRYYPIEPFRGTSPFSLTLVPVNGVPVTVDVPRSATQNQTYFIYNSIPPFALGTQFYQFMSDATGGGSGGGSPLYTIGSSSKSTDSDCTASNYQLANRNTTGVLPIGAQTATFQNLEGAVPLNHVANNGTNHGGLIGGIIGAVIGVGGILVIIGMYLIYLRRQKRKRELQRKEQPQFVDLDDDDYDGTAGGGRAGGMRRGQNGGVQQSYSVSPFTYQPAGDTSPNPNGASNELMPFRDAVDVGGMQGYSPNGLRPLSTTTSEYNASTHASAIPPHEGSSAEPYTGFFPASGNGSLNGQAPYPSFISSSEQQQHRSSPASSALHTSTRRGGSGRQMSGDVNSMYSGHSLAQHQLASPSTSNMYGTAEAYPMRTTVRHGTSDGDTASASIHGQYNNPQARQRNLSNESGEAMSTSMPFEVMLDGGDGGDGGVRNEAGGQMPPNVRRNTYMQHQDAGPVRPEDYLEEMPPSYGQWITPTGSSSNKEGTQSESK